jgi:uncharacterized protein
MKRVVAMVVLAALAGLGCKQDGTKARSATETASKATTAAPAAGSAAADPWAQPEPKKDPVKAPLLWAMEKDGKTSYLLGTIHKGVDAEARLPAYVFAKLEAAPTFAMETDRDAAAGGMLELIQCVGCSLKQQLTPAQYRRLEDLLGARTVDHIQGLKPMVAATMVALSMMPETLPMDGILLAHAQRLNKKLVYLEDAMGVAKLLAKWMDVRALRMMLDDLDDGKQQAKDMLAAYIAGDDGKLLAISDGARAKALAAGYTQAELQQQQADLLFNRNAAWIPAIEQLHAEGGGFVAVGALHLVGPGSVRELLEAKGYQITRVAR